jgi:hypothetical protein
MSQPSRRAPAVLRRSGTGDNIRVVVLGRGAGGGAWGRSCEPGRRVRIVHARSCRKNVAAVAVGGERARGRRHCRSTRAQRGRRMCLVQAATDDVTSGARIGLQVPVALACAKTWAVRVAPGTNAKSVTMRDPDGTAAWLATVIIASAFRVVRPSRWTSPDTASAPRHGSLLSLLQRGHTVNSFDPRVD